MKIEHVAIWTKDVERLRAFYEDYFEAMPGPKYVNPSKLSESYFMSFSSGARLELMGMASIPESPDSPGAQSVGYIHMAISTGSEERVDSLTARVWGGGERGGGWARRGRGGDYQR